MIDGKIAEEQDVDGCKDEGVRAIPKARSSTITRRMPDCGPGRGGSSEARAFISYYAHAVSPVTARSLLTPGVITPSRECGDSAIRALRFIAT